MPNPYFRFKRFVISHDRCAMKVGTDGVLLGAWVDVEDAPSSVLDIGTGTGLIALMIAQRAEQARIDAIDIDHDAVEQAMENVSKTQWRNRVFVHQKDVRDMEAKEPYDLIISNPPFFVENVCCPDGQRNLARHAHGLDFDELLKAVDRMLRESGKFAVVLPAKVCNDFILLAAMRHLYVYRKTWVYSKPSATPKRVLLELGREIRMWTESKLTIMDGVSYSDEYKKLTKDFYCNF